jgi:chromosome segregation ATPase
MQPDQEIDALARLEERIQQTAKLVSGLRREAAETQARVSALSGELEKLHGKREEIRTRIEKLIGQVDLLGSP